jgi:hypothetical protein
MQSELNGELEYRLPVGDELISLNPLLGKPIRLRYLEQINCLHCGRETRKSFNQGYCYPCFQTLAQCDLCIMSPERCHYHLGTCREASWGEQFCMTDHVVYLANSSGLKVGITRQTQLPTRWIDQGAVQALPIFRVATRYQSGLLETVFKQQVSDRTDWRAMLKGRADGLDIKEERDRLMGLCRDGIQALENRFGLQAIRRIEDVEPLTISYPVLSYPAKVSSLSFDKTPLIEGILQGIKGQYLILDTGVINMRKFGAYRIEVSASVS